MVTGNLNATLLDLFPHLETRATEQWKPICLDQGKLWQQLSEIGSILLISRREVPGEQLVGRSRGETAGPISGPALVPGSGFTDPFLQGVGRNTNRVPCSVHLNKVLDKLTNAR